MQGLFRPKAFGQHHVHFLAVNLSCAVRWGRCSTQKTQVVRSCTAIRKCNPRHSCGKSACGHAPQYVIIEGVHAYILCCGNTACGHAPQYTCMHACTHASSCGKPACGQAPQYHACIVAVIPHAVIRN